MPSNKPRLYVALYARSGKPKMPNLEDRFHWVLLVGPKKEEDNSRGIQYHAIDRLIGPGKTQWRFEENDTALNMLLIRITIAKIETPDRLRGILRSVPLRSDIAGWNCVAWVQEALETLETDGHALGRRVVDWAKVRDAAVGYCDKKRGAHRFDGKGEFDIKGPPTFDLTRLYHEKPSSIFYCRGSRNWLITRGA